MRDELNIREAEEGYTYQSTKTYCHNVGLSVAYRQWRAESHCRYLHGYAIQVYLEFESPGLDVRNWVVDFGSLKSLRGWLEDWFDHKTLVAEDDPQLDLFKMLQKEGLIQLRIVPATGTEAIARMVFEYAYQWLRDNGYDSVTLNKVTVHEHDANSASYGRAVSGS